jgi:hypothetical protein
LTGLVKRRSRARAKRVVSHRSRAWIAACCGVVHGASFAWTDMYARCRRARRLVGTLRRRRQLPDRFVTFSDQACAEGGVSQLGTDRFAFARTQDFFGIELLSINSCASPDDCRPKIAALDNNECSRSASQRTRSETFACCTRRRSAHLRVPLRRVRRSDLAMQSASASPARKRTTPATGQRPRDNGSQQRCLESFSVS